MERKVLEAAYGGLLHDVGKFWQRAFQKSDLNPSELQVVPQDPKAGYYHHLHAGYTSRFFKEELQIFDAFEKTVSEHHLPESPGLSKWIIQADRIASSIDRQDEHSDLEAKNTKGRFKQVRLNSVFSEVDFGKEKKAAKFVLDTLSHGNFPEENYSEVPVLQAVHEYRDLFDAFLKDLHSTPHPFNEISRFAYDRLYALLYEYATLVPASTYEGNTTFVSLFDHLKLTSAIASCLAITDQAQFRMLEFDISGIQKFIFKVTEGSQTKKGIAKALRGRSLLISLITDYVMYSYLHAFGLTQANIIFQTGGGALLLLPDTEDFEEKVSKITHELQEDLYRMFHTDITFVQASVTLDAKELEMFKVDKALVLKNRLEEEKNHKFLSLLDEDFFKEEPAGQHVCELCGENFTEKEICDVCAAIEELSSFYIKNERLFLIFDFDGQTRLPQGTYSTLSLGKMQILLVNEEGLAACKEHPAYIESINQSYLGTTRYLANLAPQLAGKLLSLEEICDLLPEEYGDPKLGILKMDVDNLGAVFAYGLDVKTRSLSKFLTLSRLMELFFGKHLPDICQEVSLDMAGEDLEYQTDNDTLFYINYAGGDDLVILGPAAAILQLARKIDQKFLEYTKNRNLTISGGIFIQRPKEPVRFGIHRAEDYLSRSKERPSKNCITLIDTVCSFAEYSDVLDWAGWFQDDMEDGKISRSNFYQIMTQLNTDRYGEFCRRVPIILYNLKRNIRPQDADYLDMWKKEIATLSADQKAFHEKKDRLVLAMKLAIMQTREN